MLTKLLGRIYYQDYVPGAKPGQLPLNVNAAVSGVALARSMPACPALLAAVCCRARLLQRTLNAADARCTAMPFGLIWGRLGRFCRFQVGTLCGQLVFGHLGDSMGRKKIYGVTLMIMARLCSRQTPTCSRRCSRQETALLVTRPEQLLVVTRVCIIVGCPRLARSRLASRPASRPESRAASRRAARRRNAACRRAAAPQQERRERRCCLAAGWLCGRGGGICMPKEVKTCVQQTMVSRAVGRRS